MLKNVEDLRRFYNSVLVSDLTSLENDRVKLSKKLTLIGIGIAIIFVILVIAYHALDTSNDGRFYFYSFFGCIALWAFVLKMLTKSYVSDFKSKIIHRIVEFINPGLKYEKYGYISKSAFINGDIFRQKPNRYKGDDYVAGVLGATHVEFSEIHAEYETRGSKGERHYHTIFKGLFFIADFNKTFSGKTLILPDTAERLFGQLGSTMQSWNKGRGELIKLEDPEFEKLFVVYGDDQIESRYILSTSLMKRIVDFKKKSNKAVYFSFIGSRIFIAISYSKDLFEPRVFKTLLDFTPIQEYYEDLQLAIGIVEDLNLNLRIWNKQSDLRKGEV